MTGATDLVSPSMAPGCVVAGRYRVGPVVGVGATGRLHVARRLGDQREVVLKLSSSGMRSARRQTRAEAHSLARLGHPNVVGFVEHGECKDFTFVAMESIRGADLESHIARGRISRGAAVLWLYEIAAALDHVHARGLAHRDVKPANVMIEERSNRAVLVDFGLATEFRRTPIQSASFVLGTPEYMAPEQALGLEGEIGPAADRYALAAVALELLTGERPYPRMTIGRLLTAILEQPPRRPSSLGVGGAALDLVFARAMARDPARRYPSAREQMEALVNALPRATRSARPSRAPRPARTVRAKAA